MSVYRAPLREMRFVLTGLGAAPALQPLPAFGELTADVMEAVLEQAARWTEDALAPLNKLADARGTNLVDGQVVLPEEIKAAYAQFVEGGWAKLAGPPDFGGHGLPQVLATAVAEMWKSANLSFSLCPMLTQGAVEAIERHGSEALKALLLPKLVSGEWTGTMNLTEPQAGSDLAAVSATAVREGAHYRVKGRKIFITWGDHDLAENIVHLVLARTPQAPAGVKGISLFAVPKFLPSADGTAGQRNDVSTVSTEHKLGIHGSPTCVLSYGDHEGAIGYLVGEENDGLRYMFTMMNRARLAVGVEGLGVAERAYQLARDYARQRVQGRAPGASGKSAIVHHPDVRRMLMTMKSYTEAMRWAAYSAALSLDLGEHAKGRAQAVAAERVAVLTPIVKAWCTEIGQEIASLGIQVHGGMGYVEETGAAQLLRDVRITTIYEGTTGIQANDLVGRKLIADGGAGVQALLDEVEALTATLAASGAPGGRVSSAIEAALRDGVAAARRAAGHILQGHGADPALAGAASVAFLMLLGTLLGGWGLARAAVQAAVALKGAGDGRAFLEAKLTTAQFYAEHILPKTQGYLASVLAGSGSIMGLTEEQL